MATLLSADEDSQLPGLIRLNLWFLMREPWGSPFRACGGRAAALQAVALCTVHNATCDEWSVGRCQDLANGIIGHQAEHELEH